MGLFLRHELRFKVPVPVLDRLLAALRRYGQTLPDGRRGKNTSYAMTDFSLAAFASFFMQSPSLHIAYSDHVELATTLYAAYHFHRLAPYGVIANLVAMPIVSIWVMPSGLLALNVFRLYNTWLAQRRLRLSLMQSTMVPLSSTPVEKVRCTSNPSSLISSARKGANLLLQVTTILLGAMKGFTQAVS